MAGNKYLSFLKWCLHSTEALPELDFSFPQLLMFAKEQAIVGIYWQGIQRLQSKIDFHLTDDEVLDWVGEAIIIKRQNIKLNNAVAWLVKQMNSDNIDYFVFKGQTVASYYPNPLSRTCGDIDFYVFKKHLSKVNKWLESRILESKKDSFQHLDFYKDGTPFEIHHHTATFARNSTQRYWDDMIESIQPVLNNIKVGNVTVPVLPPTVNAVYLFVHIYHHFLKEGIALRQFIDWMMFFESEHEYIDMIELSAILNKLDYMKAFRAFGCILVDILGMNASFFPYKLNNKDRKYENDIISIVLKYGNFGKYGRSTSVGSRWKNFCHSLETGGRSFRHICKFFRLSPRENLLWLPKLTLLSLRKKLH
jgi:hypothetical protein